MGRLFLQEKNTIDHLSVLPPHSQRMIRLYVAPGADAARAAAIGQAQQERENNDGGRRIADTKSRNISDPELTDADACQQAERAALAQIRARVDADSAAFGGLLNALDRFLYDHRDTPLVAFAAWAVVADTDRGGALEIDRGRRKVIGLTVEPESDELHRSDLDDRFLTYEERPAPP